MLVIEENNIKRIRSSWRLGLRRGDIFKLVNI